MRYNRRFKKHRSFFRHVRRSNYKSKTHKARRRLLAYNRTRLMRPQGYKGFQNKTEIKNFVYKIFAPTGTLDGNSGQTSGSFTRTYLWPMNIHTASARPAKFTYIELTPNFAQVPGTGGTPGTGPGEFIGEQINTMSLEFVCDIAPAEGSVHYADPDAFGFDPFRQPNLWYKCLRIVIFKIKDAAATTGDPMTWMPFIGDQFGTQDMWFKIPYQYYDVVEDWHIMGNHTQQTIVQDLPTDFNGMPYNINTKGRIHISKVIPFKGTYAFEADVLDNYRMIIPQEQRLYMMFLHDGQVPVGPADANGLITAPWAVFNMRGQVYYKDD